jgi:hypothetical protein
MTLPPKPAAVAHVSDALWEAALVEVFLRVRGGEPKEALERAYDNELETATDYARCLILLGEVPEPVDPIDAAMCNVFDRLDITEWARGNIKADCRKHFAGLTFPKAEHEHRRQNHASAASRSALE